MKITESQIIAACEIASKVFAVRMKLSDGVNVLISEHGLNKATASDFIKDYKYLLDGKVFHRAMSAPAMHYFMKQIFSEHGEHGLAQSITALRAHIEYYEGHYKINMHAMRKVADEFEVKIKQPRTLLEIEHAFSAAVERSLNGSQHDRLQRLANSSKKPSTITVQSTFFVRNPDVVAVTLLRAAGKCEECKADAPFCRVKDGTPYLEVHHKIHLASGGEDSPDNTTALCPNCHRRFHFGEGSET